MSLNQLIIDRFGLDTFESAEIATNKTINDILDRRSCRSFSEEPVSEKLLNALLAAAFSAPSKSDLQQRSVVLIKDAQKKKRISQLTPAIDWIDQAPVFMVWCGDNRRIRRISGWREHPFANDHLDTFMNAAVDTGIALQTMVIAAESVGLGCCPVSQIRDQIKPLSTELGLPEWVFPVAGLCIGWPNETPKLSMRLPLDVTVHVDKYNDENLITRVERYDRCREEIEQTPAAQQRMVEEYGICEDYGWSEDRSRQYAQPQREDFGSYIRGQGFNLS